MSWLPNRICAVLGLEQPAAASAPPCTPARARRPDGEEDGVEEGALLSSAQRCTRETTVKRSNQDVDGADRPSRRAKEGHTTNATAVGGSRHCLFVVLQARVRGRRQLPCTHSCTNWAGSQCRKVGAHQCSLDTTAIDGGALEYIENGQ